MSTINIVDINAANTTDLNHVIAALNKFRITGIIDFEVRTISSNLAIDDDAWKECSEEHRQFYRQNLSQQMAALLECRDKIALLQQEAENFRDANVR